MSSTNNLDSVRALLKNLITRGGLKPYLATVKSATRFCYIRPRYKCNSGSPWEIQDCDEARVEIGAANGVGVPARPVHFAHMILVSTISKRYSISPPRLLPFGQGIGFKLIRKERGLIPKRIRFRWNLSLCGNMSLDVCGPWIRVFRN